MVALVVVLVVLVVARGDTRHSPREAPEVVRGADDEAEEEKDEEWADGDGEEGDAAADSSVGRNASGVREPSGNKLHSQIIDDMSRSHPRPRGRVRAQDARTHASEKCTRGREGGRPRERVKCI